MDWAFPVGPRGSETLRFALRALDYFGPVAQLDRVFVAGVLPPYLDPDRVVHVDTIQGDGSKYVNSETNLRAVLEAGISDEFVWCDDDVFLWTHHDDIPLFSRGPIGPFVDELWRGKERAGAPAHQEWARAQREQRALLGEWAGESVDGWPHLELHAPMRLQRTLVKEILDRRDGSTSSLRGHWRMLYAIHRLPAVVIADRKLRGHQSPTPEDRLVSMSPEVWGGRGGASIRDRFWRRSRWEVRNG